MVGEGVAVQIRVAKRAEVGHGCRDLLGRNPARVHGLGRCYHQEGIAYVLLRVDLDAEVETGQGRLRGFGRSGTRRCDHCTVETRALHRDLGDVAPHFAALPVAGLVTHDHGWAVGGESGHRDVAAPGRAVPLGPHDRDDAAGIGETLSLRIPPDQVEEHDGAEVELLVQRVHGRDDLVVDAEAVVGFAQLQVDGEGAEEGRVRAASRFRVVAVHDVVPDRGQGTVLVTVPDPFGVGDDALVRQGVGAGGGGDPAGGDAHLLVVAETVEVGA